MKVWGGQFVCVCVCVCARARAVRGDSELAVMCEHLTKCASCTVALDRVEPPLDRTLRSDLHQERGGRRWALQRAV